MYMNPVYMKPEDKELNVGRSGTQARYRLSEEKQMIQMKLKV